MSDEKLIRLSNLREALRLRGIPDRERASYMAALPKGTGKLSYWSQLLSGNKSFGEKVARMAEEKLELPRGALDADMGHSSTNSSRLETGEARPRNGWPASTRVAQAVSQELVSDDLPLLVWEDVLKNAVPEIFRAALPDNALAPEHPQGTEIVWTTRRRVMPGRLMLVKDSHGQLHARLCRQGREPGSWVAAATDPAYIEFASSDDAVQVIAVFKGRLEPDDA